MTAAQLLIANDFNTVNVGNVENTKGFYYEPGIEVIDNLAGQVTIDYPLPMRLFTAGCWSDDPRPW